MFARLLWKLLRGNRGRLAVALIAVVSGAAVISALLNLQFDVQRKLTQEFRALGPNVVISAKSGNQAIGFESATSSSSGALLDESAVQNSLAANQTADITASAPFLFAVARAADVPAVVAGTWLDQLPKLNPTWKIQGSWIRERDASTDCMIGRKAAQQFQVAAGSKLTLNYLRNYATLRVAGVIDSGAAEDNQIFVSLPVAWKLTGEAGHVSLWQLNVNGTREAIANTVARIGAALPGYDVRPIRAVTEAEGNLVHRTRLLIASMVVLILVLTALCVLATMAALAMERRKDVGLMKALGGSIVRIVGLFLAEVGVLGAIGGFIGCLAGIALARWMGERVFGASITPRWEVFPATIAMMIVVALAGALPLQKLGKIKPAVILRGE
jgi:putative ABC transport system permease protein